MSKKIVDYLAILELKTGAKIEDVKQSYRDLCMIWHPDRAPDRLKLKTTEKLKLINEAYHWILSNPNSLECEVEGGKDKIIVNCPRCTKRIKLPGGVGVIHFICPECENACLYDSNVYEFTTKEKQAEKKTVARKNKIKSLLIEFSIKIKQMEHLYIYPDLPWKRIEKALSTYANLDNDEEPMVYLRLSDLNSGSMLITDRRLYWQNLRETKNAKDNRIEIQKIDKVRFQEKGEKGLITINLDRMIDLGFFPSGEESIFVEILQELSRNK